MNRFFLVVMMIVFSFVLLGCEDSEEERLKKDSYEFSHKEPTYDWAKKTDNSKKEKKDIENK